MIKVEPLLAIMNPRNIREVINAYNNITKYDKLWVSRYKSSEANQIGREYFLKHPEYTHYVRVSDDIIVTQSHVDSLIKDLEENPDIEVLGCPTNANITEEGQKLYGICTDIPAKNREERVYNRIRIEDAPKSGIHQVVHQPGACEFFSRRLLEENIVTLEQDLTAEITREHNYEYVRRMCSKRHNRRGSLPLRRYTIQYFIKRYSCCMDVVISHQLNEAGVKQYVDFALPIKHLKLPPGSHQGLLVGIEPPSVRLEPKLEREIVVSE